MRSSRSWIRILGGVAVLLAMQSLAASAAITCTEVPGQVNFQGLQVLPAAPKVGDVVELHFDVSYFVYSVTRVQLDGASPLLDGPTSLDSTRDATFHLTAVQAGRASMQLAVTYGTEEQCVDSYGYTSYRFGPDHTVTSPSYVVDIAGPAVPCAGDCDGSGEVNVDELVRGVNIALGDESLVSCAGLDRDGNGAVTIDELVAAINAALFGCTHETQPSPTPTRTNPPGSCCCGASSFEECQALARQGTCFGWGDPCPTLTPTATPAATVGPEVPALVMQHAAASLCSDTSRVEGTTVSCDALPGHYGRVSLAGYADTSEAQAAFGGKADNEEESLFSGAVLRIDSRPNPCCPSFDGRVQTWRWLSGCWIISGYAFDDTHFLLAPQPRPSIETIVNAADEVDLFSRCLASDAAHQAEISN
jgi:hypothetical protein